MNTKKIYFVCLLFICTNLFGQSTDGFYEKEGNIYYNDNLVTNVAYQENADIIRLRHLNYYGNLILKYFEKTGHYPLQSDSDIPIYVYIANKNQMEFTEIYESAIPFEHKSISFKMLVEEIEKVLGYEIDEFYDPQEYPDAKWNWYLYSINKNNFYLAIHVHQRFPFSKFNSPYSYKVEISNISNRSSNLIVEINELLNSDIFKEEMNRSVINEGYFTDREEKYIHDTKS